MLALWLQRVSVALHLFTGRDSKISGREAPLAKFVAEVAYILGIFVIGLYTANLAANLTLSNLVNEIKGIEDIRRLNGNIVLWCAEGATSPSIDTNAVHLWLFENYPDLFNRAECVDSRDKFIQRLQEDRPQPIAAFDDAVVLEDLVKDTCEVETVGDLFGLQEYAYAGLNIRSTSILDIS